MAAEAARHRLRKKKLINNLIDKLIISVEQNSQLLYNIN